MSALALFVLVPAMVILTKYLQGRQMGRRPVRVRLHSGEFLSAAQARLRAAQRR